MTISASGLRRRWWRCAPIVLGVGLAASAVHGRFPAWSSVWAVLVHASPSWLVVAALLQVVAMAAASGQQRHVLTALRIRMSASTSLAVTYTRAAMSIGLPAGSALSTAYAFRQYRGRGADSRTAAAVLVLCGAASVVTLALLYGIDLLAWAVPPTSRWLVSAAGAAGGAAVCVAARRAGRRQVTVDPVPGRADTPRGRLLATVTETLRMTGTVTVAQWLFIGCLATLNWVADAASLLAAARAAGLPVAAQDVLTAYLAVQLIRQIPLTPGGVGVAEAALLVALTTSGAGQAAAAAAVLVYRVLSYWAVLPIGLACWTVHQAAGRRPQPMSVRHEATAPATA